jgi:fructose-1,6-bisphosphatase/inositol monophosphatase family enzyme
MRSRVRRSWVKRPAASGNENLVVRWYVGPIDGTGNPSTGIPFYSVSIPEEVDDEVVAAVIGDPTRGDVFAYGDGAVRLTGVAGTRERVTEPIEAGRSFVVTASGLDAADAVVRAW